MIDAPLSEVRELKNSTYYEVELRDQMHGVVVYDHA